MMCGNASVTVRSRWCRNREPRHHPSPPPPPALSPPRRTAGHAVTVGRADTILASLKADPSLRFRDAGRSLIRWLEAYRVGMAGSKKVGEMVPDHCATSVAKLARGYARVWTEIAAQLEQRGNSAGSTSAPAPHLSKPDRNPDDSTASDD